MFQGGDVVDKAAEWSGGGEWGVGRTEAGAVAGGQPQTEQSNLELGELEQLTITNDNDLNYDQVNTNDIHMMLTFDESLFRCHQRRHFARPGQPNTLSGPTLTGSAHSLSTLRSRC